MRGSSALGAARPPTLPSDWAAADWRLSGERQRHTQLFDMAAVEESFDYGKFLRDGFVALPGVMAQPELWAAAIREGQALNDTFVRSDWATIDWAVLSTVDPEGVALAPGVPPLELRAQAVGRSQALPTCIRAVAGPSANGSSWRRDRAGGKDDPGGLQQMRRHGLIPEYFPPGHHGFFMDALYHPQMLRLQCLLFGGVPFQFDHGQIITREPGYPGGRWHSHFNGGPSDNSGMCVDPVAYGAQRNVIFLFAYPDGFDTELDGGECYNHIITRMVMIVLHFVRQLSPPMLGARAHRTFVHTVGPPIDQG